MDLETAGAVASQPSGSRVKHINKRALRNKSLSVTFNEKDLRDYVGGFHRRKKKRRKEALKQQEEKERRKRLEDRKRRRKEREYALYGGAPPEGDAKSDDEDQEQIDVMEQTASVSGITSYDNGDIKVIVTTSEIAREEEDYPVEKSDPLSAMSIRGAEKKHNIPVNKKKPFKKASKGKFRPKLTSKRDRRKQKTNGNKRKL